MDDFYTSLALVSCGVSLAMGSVYLYLGSLRKSPTHLLFGIMGISLFVFFLLPPIGFILHDEPPYPAALLFKRIFIFAYYGITPWFILHYSGYPKKWPAYALSLIIVVCYTVMFFTRDASQTHTWTNIAVLYYAGIVAFGFLAARRLQIHSERMAAWSLYVVMIAYGGLFLLGAVNQFTSDSIVRYFNVELFFPIHFHSLILFLVMGQQLVLDLFEKVKLEGHLHASNNRWQSFTNSAPFIILETDYQGNILFINTFGTALLGYQKSSELIGVNWFDRFIGQEDRRAMEQFHTCVLGNSSELLPSLKTQVKTRKGDALSINWSAFRIVDASGNETHLMGVGKNVTDEDNASKLVEQLKNELAKDQLPGAQAVQFSTSEIVGTSKALTYALQKAGQVAVTNAPVLLEGETGVGKELFASFIHSSSSRMKKAFIKVNCGALPKDLIEDELFGHEKGAFTSAIQVRKGRFELADGGTLFLDEIGELPLEMQPKLLRVLQTGEFERVGGEKTIKVNVRVLAATNRTLATEVQNGNFRSDLYYRISVFPITIPSLRQRKEDLPMLIQYFIESISRKYEKSFQQVQHTAMQRLLDHDWPGNIRELKNVIERSVILSPGTTIRFDWWDSRATEGTDNLSSVDNSLERIERDHILAVMEKCNWKINGDNGAAQMLDMNPNTLRSRMKKLNITRPAPRESPSASGIELEHDS